MTTNLLSIFGNPTPPPPPLRVPTHCPECGSPTKMDGEFLVCPNASGCPAQIAGSIKAWIGKLNILDWGDSLIESLCTAGLVSEIPDLYNLRVADIAPLQMGGRRVGESTAKKVIANLHAKKELPLHLFIGSLGIPMVARGMTQRIALAGFDTLDKMEVATTQQIAAIPGVGSTKAISFVQGIQERMSLIRRLLKAGVTVKAQADGPLKGKLLCFTGFRDADLAEQVEDAGGIMKSGVSKALHYLVAADANSDSTKAKKARSYGVEVIGIDDLKDMLA